MARIRKYEDGERLIISFESLTNEEKDKLNTLLHEFGNNTNETNKVPGVKPLPSYSSISSNIQANKNKSQNKETDTVSEITIPSANQSKKQENESQTDDCQTPRFFTELMTVYDIKTALRNLTGKPKEILEKNYKAKNFYTLDLYLELSSETELRNTYKQCIG